MVQVSSTFAAFWATRGQRFWRASRGGGGSDEATAAKRGSRREKGERSTLPHVVPSLLGDKEVLVLHCVQDDLDQGPIVLGPVSLGEGVQVGGLVGLLELDAASGESELLKK